MNVNPTRYLKPGYNLTQCNKTNHVHCPRAIRFLLVPLLAWLIMPANAADKDWRYTVSPNDTLWNICYRFAAVPDCPNKLIEYNAISDIRNISLGTIILIPVEWLKHRPLKAEAKVEAKPKAKVKAKPKATVKIEDETDAEVIEIQGYVSFRKVEKQTGINTPKRRDGKFPLSVGTTLEAGNQIYTGENSSATIRFTDGSIIIVHANSSLKMDKLATNQQQDVFETLLTLSSGSVETHVTPFKAKGSRFEIATPTAVTTVREAEYRVSVLNGGENMRSEVLEGKVDVSFGNSVETAVAGYGIFAGENIKLSPAIALLPAPIMAEDTMQFERSQFTQQWQPNADAVAYAVQLFTGAELNKLLWDKQFPTAEVMLNAVYDGDYMLQVSAIDSRGLEGLYSQQKFSVKIPIVPPTDVITEALEDTIVFHWAAHPEVAEYEVEILSTKDEVKEGSPLIENENVLTSLKTIRDNRFEVPIEGNTAIQIRIRAHYNNRKWSDYSDDVLWNRPNDSGLFYLALTAIILLGFSL